MPPINHLTREKVEEIFFCKLQNIRLFSIWMVKELPANDCKEILLKGLRHWDRKLRIACAKELTQIFNQEAIPFIIEACNEKHISFSLTIELISRFDTDEVIEYLLTLSEHNYEAIRKKALGVLDNIPGAIKHIRYWEHFISSPQNINHLIKKINILCDEEINRIISTFKLDDKKIYLKNEKVNEFLQQRGIKLFFSKSDAMHTIKSTLIDECIVWDIFNALSKNELVSAIFTMEETLRVEYLNNPSFIDYVKSRGAIEIEYLRPMFLAGLYSENDNTKIKFTEKQLFDNPTPISTFEKQLPGQLPCGDRFQNQYNNSRSGDQLSVVSLSSDKRYEESPTVTTPIIPSMRAQPLDVIYGINRNLLFWVYRKRHSINRYYKSFSIKKKSGGFRFINSSRGIVKELQKLVLRKVLYTYPLHKCCHGFRPGCSIVSNAFSHTNKEVVINLDIMDFFPSISASRVYGLFRSLGFNEGNTRFLTDLTTFKSFLPQGAPTSPMISNLICRKLDNRLSKLADTIGADYTRYADDLTFSGNSNIVNSLPLIKQIVRDEGFAVAENKVRIKRKGNRQEVTGLTVNSGVAVPRKIRRQLRSVLHHIKNGREISWNERPLSLSSLKGYLSYLMLVQPTVAINMIEKMILGDEDIESKAV